MMLKTLNSSRVPRLTCSRSLGCTRGGSRARRAGFTLLEVLVVVAILVILATVATIATSRYIEEAKKSKAQLGCQSIATAIEAYQTSNSNPGVTDDERMPQDLSNLYNPPPEFGGGSFLRNGQADTIDPWGKPYQFARQPRADGTMYILVHTSAPDGTPISQFGIGPVNSQPKN
jgi:general secretion pathway protein G